MNHTAPIELAQLGLDPARFKRSDARSWRGPCPRCGGARRCLCWTDHPFPKWRVECDGCGLKAWADTLNTALRQPVSDEMRREWDARNAAERSRREAAKRAALARFSDTDIAEEHHRRMTREQRRHWREAGIPDSWQDIWRLGFMADKCYRSGSDLHHSPAMTIPYFHTGRVFQTMQYRLTHPANPQDRYRFEANLPATYYQTNPDEAPGNEVVICEGAKKAMVLSIIAPPDVTVLAVPSKSSSGDVAQVVSECGRVWVILDPDAERSAAALCKAVGEAARAVTVPVKVDDAITLHGATWATFQGFMKAGRA